MDRPTEQAASPDWRFDHVNLQASDGSALHRLFVEVMGLRPGRRPPFPFPGQWLYGEAEHALVHVVDGRGHDAEAVRLGHVAFRTDRPAAVVIDALRRAGLPFEATTVPGDGEVQLFVPLPGGLLIELDAPAH